MSETVTMTLTEFLLARIEADEYLARLADDVTDGVEDDWQDVTQPLTHAETQTRPPEQWATKYGHAYQHISAMSPARVLAECEAKRRIVAIATDQIRLGREARGWDNWEDMANQTLRALALPYADHPDYREEWRP